MEIAHTSIGAEHLGGLIALSVAVAVLRLSLAKMRIRGRKRTERKMVLDKIYRRRNGRQILRGRESITERFASGNIRVNVKPQEINATRDFPKMIYGYEQRLARSHSFTVCD